MTQLFMSCVFPSILLGCLPWVPNCKLNPDTGGYFIDIVPSLIIQGGPPFYHRAAFVPNIVISDSDGSNPGWHRICAPLVPLDSKGNLPSNVNGTWYMASPNNILGGLPPLPGPPSPDSAWDDLITDITAIQLPVDFTGNPAERIGYDNICMVEKDCTDYCDPEPLCYWQHQWNCEYAERYRWFPTITKWLESGVLGTFNERTCICDVLNGCCKDRCEMAEQELMALLLNIASGQLGWDCCVMGCAGDTGMSVKDIVFEADELLKLSGRSDYDCSKALKLLTGINKDFTLCDSEEN